MTYFGGIVDVAIARLDLDSVDVGVAALPLDVLKIIPRDSVDEAIIAAVRCPFHGPTNDGRLSNSKLLNQEMSRSPPAQWQGEVRRIRSWHAMWRTNISPLRKRRGSA